MDGTYSFVYCGSLGVGLGIFTLTDTQMVGCCLAGARYKGLISKNTTTGGFNIALEQTVPVGVALVQGTSPQGTPYTKSLSGELPADFADGKPIDLELPPGVVTVMIRRVPDVWAPYARGVNVTITPQT